MSHFARPGSFRVSKQFFMSREPFAAPHGWLSRMVAGYQLSHSPDIPVREFTSAEATGLLLGWPLFPHAESLGDVGGRWVFIAGNTVRLDPLGSYAVVYSRELGAVASTAALFDEASLVPDDPLMAALGLPQKDRFYPFGLTPHQNVRRLLPNHVLHLDDLRVTTDRPEHAALSDEEAVRRIGDNIRASVEAIGTGWPIIAGGTAGNETRVLLAALRNVSDVELFTMGNPASQDAVTAAYLARKLRYAHVMVAPVDDAAYRRQWFRDVGQSVAGATLINSPAKAALPSHKALLKGMGGEIGRAYYYRPIDQATVPISTEGLLRRMRLPVTAQLVSAAEHWSAEASAADTFDLLDLLYLENRVGAWASPQLHGDTSPPATFFPFNQASTIAGLRALSHDVKVSDTMGPLVVRHLWPKLLSVPINAPFEPSSWPQKVATSARRTAGTMKRWLHPAH